MSLQGGPISFGGSYCNEKAKKRTMALANLTDCSASDVEAAFRSKKEINDLFSSPPRKSNATTAASSTNVSGMKRNNKAASKNKAPNANVQGPANLAQQSKVKKAPRLPAVIKSTAIAALRLYCKGVVTFEFYDYTDFCKEWKLRLILGSSDPA